MDDLAGVKYSPCGRSVPVVVSLFLYVNESAWGRRCHYCYMPTRATVIIVVVYTPMRSEGYCKPASSLVWWCRRRRCMPTRACGSNGVVVLGNFHRCISFERGKVMNE
ncbi:hypothetical protein Droror1_Dr00024949 [Drosera rotundifolia]